MTKRYDINTLIELERYYGGQKGLQAKFSLSQPSVSHWRRRGVPTGYHLRIYLELRMAGKTVNPEIFEIDDPHLSAVLNDYRLSA
jgi:hypothetical protein